jgi:Helicase conserved C-terminal domain
MPVADAKERRIIPLHFYKMLVPVIVHLAKSGPVLVIEGTRPLATKMAQAIAETQPLTNDYHVKAILDLVEARLGAQHPLRKVLQNGVAYHHSSLPSEIRVAIEDAIVNGYIKYIVATTTMAEGVNLPVRSVVIASQGSHSSGGYTEYIIGSKLVNVIGRAGRATKETEGIVVLALQSRPDITDFERLNPKSDDVQVVSMLATESALDELALFEYLQRSTEDALFQIAGNIVSNFLSFVWFTASELERIGNEYLTIEQLGKVLAHTLGWIQLPDEYKNRWLEVASLTLDRYKTTDANLRRRWAAAGTSISSAGKIEGICVSLANSIVSDGLPEDTIQLIRVVLADGRLDQILALPEAPQRLIFTRRSGRNRPTITLSIEDLFVDWIQGNELVEIANEYLSAVADIDYRLEQLCDLLNQYFEVFFPWVLGTIVAWTNQILIDYGFVAVLPGGLPAYVRWGVGNAQAVELMSKGMASRTLAMRIATGWSRSDAQVDVLTWLRSLNLTQWQQFFSASITELRLLLEFCRDQKGGPAAELLISGTTSISTETHLEELSPSPASIQFINAIELSAFGIWVNDELVGKIAARDQSDIQAIISSGLEYSVAFSVHSGVGTLQFDLVNPENY